MKAGFEGALAVTLKFEGGYSNDPRDPGGETNRGITKRVYENWLRLNKKPIRSVKDITEREVHDIYRVQYWNLINGDKLPDGVALVVFDFAVNSGATRAIKTLQEVLGIKEDGDAGAVTLSAISDKDPVDIIEGVSAKRLAFMRRLSGWAHFGRGWQRRVDAVRAAALRLVGGDTVAFVSVPDDEVEVNPTSAKADSTQVGFMSTDEGKGAIAAGAGTVGSMLSDTAQRFERFADISTAFQILFAVLTIGGIALVAYSMISRIKRGGNV